MALVFFLRQGLAERAALLRLDRIAFCKRVGVARIVGSLKRRVTGGGSGVSMPLALAPLVSMDRSTPTDPELSTLPTLSAWTCSARITAKRAHHAVIARTREVPG
ncbi:MAG: hypothetical protein IT557_06150 [Alphaproteobacteria bacterium]|nr:hypothetical protein [Alphaproteobacteria bacterium]